MSSDWIDSTRSRSSRRARATANSPDTNPPSRRCRQLDLGLDRLRRRRQRCCARIGQIREYRCGGDGAREPVEVGACTDDGFQPLLQSIITRLTKLLARRGVLAKDMGPPCWVGRGPGTTLPAQRQGGAGTSSATGARSGCRCAQAASPERPATHSTMHSTPVSPKRPASWLRANGFGSHARPYPPGSSPSPPAWRRTRARPQAFRASQSCSRAARRTCADLATVQRVPPWFRVMDGEASGRITLRHLLNQTSGFSRDNGIALLLQGSTASIDELARGKRA